MKFAFARALLFAAIGLPVGFILTALAFAATEASISAPAIFPWAITVSLLAGIAGGFWRPGR